MRPTLETKLLKRLDPVISARGLATLREAFGRVGIKTVPTRLERAYNAGETAQEPSGRVVGVTRRVRHKLGCGGFNLSFEPAAKEVAAALGTRPALVEKGRHVVRTIDFISDVETGGMMPTFSGGAPLSMG